MSDLTAEQKALCLKAADVVNERGHSKHVNETAAGEVCIRGAVMVACHGSPFAALGLRHSCAAYPLLDALDEDVPGYSAVSYWNDAPERTKAEVVAFLREAGRS